MSTEMQWQPMQANDIEAVWHLAEIVHPGLPERLEVMAERQQLYPAGCWVLRGAEGAVLGYAISHPIAPQKPPKLDCLLGAIARDASHYYLHDIVLHPDARGGGRANAVVEILLREAEGFDLATLVSVYGTAPFWQRFGFEITPLPMAEALAPYGEGAVYMTRATTGS